MLSKKGLSAKNLKKVRSLPTCQVDEEIADMAHIDINSAKIKFGGIRVTVYLITKQRIEGPREIRQKKIKDLNLRKKIINIAQDRKSKEKAKKKPLSAEKKYFPRHSPANI